MMGKKTKEVQGVKYYSIEYLMNKELNENDLYELFETPSLHYSLFLGMFAFMGDRRGPDELIKMGKEDENWMYRNFWTDEQKRRYTDMVTRVFKNVYQVGDENARYNAEHWVFTNGLSLENLRKSYAVKYGKFYN